MIIKQIFEVTGSGLFPFDMLRYDTCWPHSQEDVSKIENPGMMDKRTVKLVRVTKNKNALPTTDRWASFGWIFHPATIELYTA